MVGRRRISGTVREEDAVRLQCQHLVDAPRGRDDVHLDATACHLLRGHGLDAEIDGDHGEARLPDRGNDVWLRGRDIAGEVGPGHGGARLHLREEVGRCSLGIGAAEDPHAHRTALAQVPGECTGVDAADADDPLLDEVVLQASGRTPVRRDPRGIPDDVARHPDARGLAVLVVHAGVADVRGRHDDHLASVRRIGQGLLVAAHSRGEDGLTEGRADGTVGVSMHGAAILEDEDGGHWGALQVGGGHRTPVGNAAMRPSNTVV